MPLGRLDQKPCHDHLREERYAVSTHYSACFKETRRTDLDALAAFLACIKHECEVHTGTDLFQPGITGQCAKHRTLPTTHTRTAGKTSFDLGQKLHFGNGSGDLGFTFCDTLITWQLGGAHGRAIGFVIKIYLL